METVLFLLYFAIAAFLAFYVPGKVILAKQKNLSNLGEFVVSIILGIVLWGWQGYIFGFLNLRFLSYVYLLIFLAIFIKQKYFSFKFKNIHFRNIDWVVVVMATVGIVGQIIPFIRNGQMTSSGLFISNNNNIDHIWHVSLVEELVRHFPPNEPAMFGVLLTNYHFWFHLVTAELVRVFHLPIFQTQFIGMYGLGPILLALITYVLGKAIYDQKLFLRVFFFFIFFSGNFSQQLMLLLTHRLDFSVGWVFEDATKLMDAPGCGMAMLIVFSAIYLLLKNKSKISKKNIFITGLLFGSLMGFKIYYAIPFMMGLFCFAIFKAFRKQFAYLWVFIIASVLFLLQYLPFNISSGGIFILPFEIPRAFMAQTALNLTFIDERWRIYLAHNNYFRILEYGIFMSVVYFFTQFGFKLLGLLPLKRTIKALGLDMTIFLYASMFCSFILGLFFYQRVGGANIWEFFFAASLVLAITVSLNLSLFLSKINKKIALVIIVLIILFTIPSWVQSVGTSLKNDYFSKFHGVSKIELQADDYLKNNTPQNSLLLLVGEPNYVVASSITSVLTERNLFLSGVGVSQEMTPEKQRREKDVEFIELSKNSQKVNEILKNDKINYVVFYNKSSIATVSGLLKNQYLDNVFSNKIIRIFKVN